MASEARIKITRPLRSNTQTLKRNLLKSNVWLRLFLAVVVTALLLPPLTYLYVTNVFANQIVSNSEVLKPVKIGIVFGASVFVNEGPSPILQERLDAAVKLYKQQKINHILVSGDNRAESYDEPAVMTDYLVEAGIPEDDISADEAGIRTYDSCYRARYKYSITEAVLITQEFHLYRALYLCEAAGIRSQGFAADQGKLDTTEWRVRDFFALLLAIWQVNIDAPTVEIGEKVRIY